MRFLCCFPLLMNFCKGSPEITELQSGFAYADREPPRISLYPSGGVVRSGTILKILASEPVTSRITIDDHYSEIPVLDPGSHIVRIHAADTAGNESVSGPYLLEGSSDGAIPLQVPGFLSVQNAEDAARYSGGACRNGIQHGEIVEVICNGYTAEVFVDNQAPLLLIQADGRLMSNEHAWLDSPSGDTPRTELPVLWQSATTARVFAEDMAGNKSAIIVLDAVVLPELPAPRITNPQPVLFSQRNNSIHVDISVSGIYTFRCGESRYTASIQTGLSEVTLPVRFCPEGNSELLLEFRDQSAAVQVISDYSVALPAPLFGTDYCHDEGAELIWAESRNEAIDFRVQIDRNETVLSGTGPFRIPFSPEGQSSPISWTATDAAGNTRDSGVRILEKCSPVHWLLIGAAGSGSPHRVLLASGISVPYQFSQPGFGYRFIKVYWNQNDIPDVLAGNPDAHSGAGEVLLLLDPLPGDPGLRISGSWQGLRSGDGFGSAISGLRRDTDGNPWFIAGAPGFDTGGVDTGCLMLVRGGSAECRFPGKASQERLGGRLSDDGSIRSGEVVCETDPDLNCRYDTTVPYSRYLIGYPVMTMSGNDLTLLLSGEEPLSGVSGISSPEPGEVYYCQNSECRHRSFGSSWQSGTGYASGATLYSAPEFTAISHPYSSGVFFQGGKVIIREKSGLVQYQIEGAERAWLGTSLVFLP